MKLISVVLLAIFGAGLAQAPATADGVEPDSMSQCGSGDFCGWASTGFSGAVAAVSGVGKDKTLSWSTQSYYNNRALAAKLYNALGMSYLCFGPGESRTSVPADYVHPSVVYLSNVATC